MTSPAPKEYFDLVKSIGESKSKQEEDRIVAEELQYLKKAFQQQGISKKKLKELVVRGMYIEMLGQDASFAYIKAVELCASTSITQKKVGYLAASVFLSPDHEFRFMLVNQIQRDMKSTNMLEVCTALTAVCKLVTVDMIPAVIGDVLNLLKHDMDIVRKRAIGALHRFYQMDKQSVLDHVDKVRKSLCDKDPSVMGATLPLLQDMIQDDVLMFKDLASSFVAILKQIVDHRLPREFDYHRIPSPWIQMSILKILAFLGRGDLVTSEGMYEVIIDAMKRADTGINVGYAIVYECVKTITTIYPNTILLDAAATSISRFIRSESHNLKYIGIKGLAAIVKDHPKYAADHQMAVIDCLEDPDETLKRKTLDLLFRMTNAVNVEFIVEKLLSFLENSSDDHFRSDLVNQITQCAERFAPSNTWYVQTIIQVFELAGDKVNSSVAQTLIQLIAEGAEFEDDDEDLVQAKDNELRAEAVEHFLDLLTKPKLSSILVQTMSWVLGEYGYLSSTCTKEVIMDRLCTLLHQTLENESKCHLVTALSKLIAQTGTCPSRVLNTINFYKQSRSLDLQQRCLEISLLLQNPDIMVDVLPVDASCEDIEVDENLNFLNNFVQTSLNLGARPYAPPKEFLEETDDSASLKNKLNITPYSTPTIPPPSSGFAGSITTMSNTSAGPTPLGPAINNQQAPPLSIATAQGNQLINTRGITQVWGKKPEPPPPAPTPVVSQPTPPAAPEVQTPTINTHGLPNVWGAPAATTAPSSSSAVPVAPPAPEVPRVLSEKEKMAAALFGGVGATSGKSTAGAGKRRASTTGGSASASPLVQSVPAAVPAAAPIASNDLFSGMSSAASPNLVPVSAPILPTAAPLPPANLFGDVDLLGGSVPHTSTPIAAVPSSGASHVDAGLLDLTMSPASFTPATPIQITPSFNTLASVSPVHTSSNLISDAFGAIDLTSTPVLAPENYVKPLVINTQEFGRRWGSTPVESKQSITCPQLNPFSLETFRRAMPSNYHHVESIMNTLECIYAANATNYGAVILVHAKLHHARKVIDILVKSTKQEITSQEVALIAHSISQFRG